MRRGVRQCRPYRAAPAGGGPWSRCGSWPGSGTSALEEVALEKLPLLTVEGPSFSLYGSGRNAPPEEDVHATPRWLAPKPRSVSSIIASSDVVTYPRWVNSDTATATAGSVPKCASSIAIVMRAPGFRRVS